VVEIIRGIGVNDLYYHGMRMLRTHGEREETRNGPAMVMPVPVTSVYEFPKQRVLFDVGRAANPFFHLFESLWMLAGRDDVAALNFYITDFGTRFAEKNGGVHGAYGYRWRKALGFDQLEIIVAKLRKNSQDRQCVLQMWDATEVRDVDSAGSIQLGCDDLRGDWRDRPCNTHVYFRVRTEVEIVGISAAHGTGGAHQEDFRYLDMTVLCRSNDIVYGAYGANAVHFSILQEYVAGRIGARVGRMYQISNNYHAYLDVLDRVGRPALVTYDSLKIHSTPMGTKWDEWDEDLGKFMSWQSRMLNGEAKPANYTNSWFVMTAEPMFYAHWLWKQAMKNEARNCAQLIEAEDWRHAALRWFDMRTQARSR